MDPLHIQGNVLKIKKYIYKLVHLEIATHEFRTLCLTSANLFVS